VLPVEAGEKVRLGAGKFIFCKILYQDMSRLHKNL